MPTITYSENPDDIRITLRLIASQLTDETMFLVNLDDIPSVEQLIAQLRTFLPGSSKNLAEIPESWTAYDEPVTRQMLLELAKTWSETSGNLILSLKQRNSPWSLNHLSNILPEIKDIPFKSHLYKGHLYHAYLAPHWDSMKSNNDKRFRFWPYVLRAWILPSTPTDWIPPDMR